MITATQMLESMIHSPEPTRAEASDVANAILDGTSAIMLSGETAVGEYPVEAVAVMDRIALAVEPNLGYRHETPQASDAPTIDQAMSNAACDVAEALSAKAILVPTFTGRTASAVARLRPQRAILALTHKMESLRHMALEWGVTPLEIPETTDVEDLWARSIDAAARVGDRRAGRAGRDHGGHGGEHPGLDQRDQGRHRVEARLASALNGRKARRRGRGGDGEERRRGREGEAEAHARAAPEGAAVAPARASCSASSGSSTSVRSPRTSRRATSSTSAAPRWRPSGRSAHASTARLERATSLDELARAARRIGYVRPGEHLFIVKGTAAWQRRHAG